jgi:fructose-bisphosphate aldolase class II
MIVPTKDLFKVAYGKFAVGAYNINNLEQTMGLFRGCIDSQAPFIIQLSKGARSYTDKEMLESIILGAEKVFPDAIFACIWTTATSRLATTASTPASTPAS